MASIAVSCILMIYYNVVIAWALRFFIASMTDHLPWEDCDSCQCLLYRQEYTNSSSSLPVLNAQNETIPNIQDLLVNNSYGLNCSEYI